MLAGAKISALRVADGLVSIDVGEGYRPWTKRRARKPGECVLTGRRFEIGADVYGPVGNQLYRAARIIAKAIDTKL